MYLSIVFAAHSSKDSLPSPFESSFANALRRGESNSSASIRPFVREIVERFRSQTSVLSQAEIHPRARLKTVGSI